LDVIRGNVLVIEDDSDCGTMILDILARAGYGVRLVGSRDTAVVAMRRYIYDFVVLDIRMPGMSVEDFQRATASYKQPDYIVLTAQEKAEAEAKKYGISNWVGKPFSPEKLVETLRDLTKKRRKTGELPLPQKPPDGQRYDKIY
jgi:DNA-binding NtrC family response regulator